MQKEFYLEDLGSSNGTFVNRERISNAELELGDVIYIMGFKIIIGTDFIAYNNPDKAVQINSVDFLDFINAKRKNDRIDYYDEEEEIEEDYFIRTPRFKRDISPPTFNLASVPRGQNQDDTPAILTFGPSLTMGMGSMVSAVTSLATFQIPAAITSLGMLAGSLGFPTATRKYQQKLLKEERRKERQEKFSEYLEEVEEKIEEEIKRQKEILEENYLTINQCKNIVNNIDQTLWNRTIDQNDFLKLRVGIGNTKLNANINYQKKDFELNTDNLEEQMRMFSRITKINRKCSNHYFFSRCLYEWNNW